MDIIREYPEYKFYTMNRYDVEDFKKYSEINIDYYMKWKDGINFNTNRKIKVGGIVHKKIGRDFYIKGRLFTALDGIESESYMEETKNIIKKIEDHHSKIRSICNEIDLLKNWEDYVLFEGVKYGIPQFYDNIHRTNNCFGKIDVDIRGCDCNNCNWRFCGRSEYYYTCLKCKYRFHERK